MNSPRAAVEARTHRDRTAPPAPQPSERISWATSWRAVRLGFRQPWRLAASIALACLAAACWGGNIAAFYPLLEVTLNGRSLPQWNDQRIAGSTQSIADLVEQVRKLMRSVPDRKLSPSQRSDLQALQRRILAERHTLEFSQTLQPWLGQIFTSSPFQNVVLVVTLLLAVTMFKNICSLGNVALTSSVAQRIMFDLRRQFFDAMLRADIHSFEKKRTSQLWTRFVRDIPFVCQGLTALFGRAVSEPLKIVSCLVGAAFVNWRLLVVSMLIAPIAGGTIALLAHRMRRLTLRAHDQDAETNDMVFEVLQGLPIVQAYTMEPVERERFRGAAAMCWSRATRVILLRALSKPAVELFGIGIVGTAILAGAHLVLNKSTHLLGFPITSPENPLTITMLLVFFGMLIGIYDPLRKMAEVLPQIQMGFAAADRLFPAIDAEPKVIEAAQPKPLPKPHGLLQLEDVHFHYQSSRPVLRGVSLTIPRGETVAIVGPNGCGKSTLANLIPRFYDPTQGQVRIDGIDLREASLAEIRQRIGLVTQQAHLFDESVAKNIRFGRPGATREEIVNAAKQAFAHDFIVSQLAEGYDTVVGQGGNRLSGGQRQRIALARAILRDPEILILDEPTSQVDLQSEQLIRRALETFCDGRTVVLITHRLSLLSLASRIVVLQGGVIADVGTHEELQSRCRLYQHLHEIQHQDRSAA